MTAITLLLLRVVLATAWMVWHVRLGLSVTAGGQQVPTWWRFCAWLPPFSPIFAWLMKLRGTSIVWVLLAGLYLAVTVAS